MHHLANIRTVGQRADLRKRNKRVAVQPPLHLGIGLGRCTRVDPAAVVPAMTELKDVAGTPVPSGDGIGTSGRLAIGVTGTGWDDDV